MLGHSEQMYDFVFGSGDGAEGAAELNHYPVFSDHNDFLFGEAGNDEIYGGSGGDYMIGGQGADSMEGGTGDDQIYGDGSEEIGGLPDGDLKHEIGRAHVRTPVNNAHLVTRIQSYAIKKKNK